MLPKNRRPTPPGEILQHEFIEPLGLTQKQLAEALGITRIRVNEIIRGKRGITTDTAFRFSKFFGTTVDFWIGLQADVDMWDTLRTHQREYERIKPIAQAANE
ncbi:MAG: HigA family addiction module antitoxin [Syntrophobacteraceae bacterium]